MSRYMPCALNRKLSREDGRPVYTGAFRFNRQRWFRHQIRWHKRRGSGFCGRFAFMSRYDF